MVKVLQCNINHCRVAQDLLAQYAIEKRIGIVVVAEPYNIPCNLSWSSNTNNNIAVYWNHSYCKSSGIKSSTGLCTLTTSWQEFNIIACYFPPNMDNDAYGDFLDEMEIALNAVGGVNTIICGDFNSKSQLWGSKLTDLENDLSAGCRVKTYD